MAPCIELWGGDAQLEDDEPQLPSCPELWGGDAQLGVGEPQPPLRSERPELRPEPAEASQLQQSVRLELSRVNDDQPGAGEPQQPPSPELPEGSDDHLPAAAFELPPSSEPLLRSSSCWASASIEVGLWFMRATSCRRFCTSEWIACRDSSDERCRRLFCVASCSARAFSFCMVLWLVSWAKTTKRKWMSCWWLRSRARSFVISVFLSRSLI